MNEKIKKQFAAMKAKHTAAVLLFKVGDFYESYAEDAAVVSELLGIIVTERDGVKVAAFPYSALDGYLPKLVRAGKRVAMCDQLTDEPATTSQTSNSSKAMEVQNILAVDIKPSPLNPRKTFDPGSIEELAANIVQNGLLQPITVRPVKGKEKPYEIVCGERRYRAWLENMKMSAKFPNAIPCIVRDMTDEEALDAMITENLQRQDVDPIEEAFAFGQLVKNGKTIEEIALRFGKSKRFIAERIKLDNLLPELKKMVTDGILHIGAAMHVCKLTEDEQRDFIEWCAGQENITKHDAEDFTDDLFMKIERADWADNFTGSCGTTCEKCPFNNANVGCLFYEMKPHDATCTNRAKWNGKRFSWLCRLVDDQADVLVKEGDNLETGKTVVVAEPSQYYQDKNTDYEPLLEYIRTKGFKVAKKEDYFERYSSYREDDERLQEKLANNEVYRVLSVEATWRGVEIHIRYYAFTKQTTEESADEVRAMQLVNEYKENQRKNATSIASKLRGILHDMNPTELPSDQMTQTENIILLTMILKKCSHEYRKAIDLTATYTSEPAVLNYVREHTADAHKIARDYIRHELEGAGVEYDRDLQECQSLLLKEWAAETTEGVVTEMRLKLAKKQAKIEEQLTALGYNTDGTKMDF